MAHIMEIIHTGQWRGQGFELVMMDFGSINLSMYGGDSLRDAVGQASRLRLRKRGI